MWSMIAWGCNIAVAAAMASKFLFVYQSPVSGVDKINNMNTIENKVVETYYNEMGEACKRLSDPKHKVRSCGV
jgi:hypothetical protein